MTNPSPTQYAWMARDAVGSVVAATVVVGVLGVVALWLGIAGGSPIVAILGAVLVVLAGLWTARGISRVRTSRQMRARFGDGPGAGHQPTE